MKWLAFYQIFAFDGSFEVKGKKGGLGGAKVDSLIIVVSLFAARLH